MQSANMSHNNNMHDYDERCLKNSTTKTTIKQAKQNQLQNITGYYNNNRI